MEQDGRWNPQKLSQITENKRAGDRDRTGDVQLGKLAFYR